MPTIRFNLIRRVFVGIAIGLMASTLLSADEQKSSSFGNVLIPQPAKPGNADNCVEPTAVMRRDHMEFLLHQRDNTVIDGIRTKKYSLTGCIDCHAQPDDNGVIVRSDNPEFFCTSCHQYASVKIDCFECHADRPVASFSQNKTGGHSSSALAGIDVNKLSTPDTSGVHNKLLQRVSLSVD